jgi:hypothetical protein
MTIKGNTIKVFTLIGAQTYDFLIKNYLEGT